MNLIENIKKYIKNKDKDEETGLAPDGVCPNY